MKVRLAAAIVVLSIVSQAFAQGSPWDRAFDAATGTRFIPVELWTGAQWDGEYVVRMLAANLEFGRGKRITGPMPWTPPDGGAAIQVYERVNRGKRQLFALRSDDTGLGRVYDSRYPRYCPGEVKFPLGHWKQGEARDYVLACGDGSKRTLRVTIEHLDFTYASVAHSLQFHWLLDGGRGRATDMHYVYSPGFGMVHEYGNE